MNEPKPEAKPEAKSISPLPQPTLPKGGGAIRSIGEKFSANPATGAGAMSVPIFTSPGRGGFQPTLSIEYSSGTGTGPFGIGWSLSVPRITRKTDKGLPRYLDGKESDTFILSGAEDLVPLVDANRAFIERTETDATLSASCVVRTYRPRVDSLYARIERWTVIATGDSFWRSITKDNIVSCYGRSTQARITDPQNALHVFTWLLEESRDGKGNVISYRYKAEDQDGIDTTVALEPVRPIANTYLKSIYYGNQTPDSAADWHFQVLFDYGELDANDPINGTVGTWPGRPDPTSSFRSTFEIRTYRLCRRVLMLHSFVELGTGFQVVRSTDFTYQASPIATKLTSAVQRGWMWTGSVYQVESLPAIDFQYSEAVIDPAVRVLDDESLRDLPAGVDGHDYQLLDLDGEGLSGIFSQQGQGFYYKRNLGQGRFAPAARVGSLPSTAALAAGGQQLTDLDGSGAMSLVQLDGATRGFYERTNDGDWSQFRTFSSSPKVDWRDRGLRFLDLDGDGLPDALQPAGRADNVLRWWPSLGLDGYGDERRCYLERDESRAPYLIWSDPTQAVFAADMTGDGLPDLVRVKPESIAYWPNLGYGRFGAKRSLGAPDFGAHDQFDPGRVHLADIDGSGTADLIYVDRGGARIWLNHAGNRLSSMQTVTFPDAAGAHVTVTDLLGKGTACLVWSSPLPRDRGRQVRYVDLMSGAKPHLLTSVSNNLGATTTIEYQASTEYYLQDRAAGLPWITKLPFPVQVVSKVTINEAVTGTALVTTYRYHHGYYDGIERELNGFGMVEQDDAETVTEGAAPPETYTAPKRTKTWFHTGALIDSSKVSRQYANEYWAGDAQAIALPDSLLPSSLLPEETREAMRALRGRVLRQEVYGLDGSEFEDNPYSVSESNFEVRKLQSKDKNRYAIFDVIARETLSYHYERNPADPRVQHDLALEVDDFGSVRQSVALAYPRRTSQSPTFAQDRLLATYAKHDVVNVADQSDWYRAGVPYEAQSWQLVGFTPAAAIATFAEISSFVGGTLTDITFDTWPLPATPGRVLMEHTQQLYWNDALSGPLALGAIESRALAYESSKLCFTDGMIASAWVSAGDPTDATMVSYAVAAGYDHRSTEWWRPSGRTSYSASNFYQATSFVDAYHVNPAWQVAYDGYSLLLAGATDPVGNQTLVTVDYRVLQPSQVQDPNGNRAQAAYDALGRVIATAVMGKAAPATQEGDTLSAPTTTIEYVLNQVPAYAHVSMRETHGDPSTRWQESYTYSDGLGREVMKKIQAEPDASNNPRWIGTGRIIFDNKGNPVKKYEPFFSSTNAYEATVVGVSDLLHYDAANRVIRTDHPNGTFATVSYGAWAQVTRDENDNVLESDWLNRAGQSTADQRATTNTLAHRHTPAESRFDALGRVVATIADNTTQSTTDTSSDNATKVLYETRFDLDIQGNQRTIWDAKALAQNSVSPPYAIQSSIFDLSGRAMYANNLDSGARWVITTVLDTPSHTWDGRGYAVRFGYDGAHRPAQRWESFGGTNYYLMEARVYGEAATDATLNLRGKVYYLFDQSGLHMNDHYDFKGNLLQWTRRLAVDFSSMSDWADTVGMDASSSLPSTVTALVQSNSYTTQTQYDALNRIVSSTTPDASVTTPTYNLTGLLEAIDVTLQGSTLKHFITGIDYNEKNQRTRVTRGTTTAVTTTYQYDPQTFRSTNLQTTRGTDVLQDLTYTYDPVGNVVELDDAAQVTIFYANTIVSPTAQYVYDSIYRLISASGREHAGQATSDQTFAPSPGALLDPNDANQMRLYTQNYDYDEVGNFQSLQHQVSVPSTADSWTRTYAYASYGGNRLVSTTVGSTTSSYTPDTAGNMVATPNLPSMSYTTKNELSFAQLTAGPDSGNSVYMRYDAAGERMRKVVWTPAFVAGKERIYLGGFEVYVERDSSNAVTLERQTLHVYDGHTRIALVETRAQGTDGPQQLIRHQLDNHLGSAITELDGTGAVISYEEYHPYGTTAYRGVTSTLDKNPKRYSFTGKERDEETGFTYHGARNYAPWLGRWTTADPLGVDNDPNLYEYASSNPIVRSDASGLRDEPVPYVLPPIELRANLHQAGQESHRQSETTVNVEPKDTSSDEMPRDLQQKLSEGKNAIFGEHLRQTEFLPFTEGVGLDALRTGVGRIDYFFQARAIRTTGFANVKAGIPPEEAGQTAWAARRTLVNETRQDINPELARLSGMRDQAVYTDPGGPKTYADVKAGAGGRGPKTDLEVINSAGKTNLWANLGGGLLTIVGLIQNILLVREMSKAFAGERAQIGIQAVNVGWIEMLRDYPAGTVFQVNLSNSRYDTMYITDPEHGRLWDVEARRFIQVRN